MALRKKITFILFFLFTGIITAYTQVKILKGVVLDKQSDEPITFASVVFKVSGGGILTDSIGRFSFPLNN